MNKDQEIEHQAAVGNNDGPSPAFASRFYLVAILILILIALGMYLWKVLAVRNLQEKMELQRTEMIQDRKDALDNQAGEILRLSVLPLDWAVRSEMMRGNLSQVDDYFREFVQEAGVQTVFLIDSKNKVILATNRKLETQSGDRVVSSAIMEAEDAVIERTESRIRLGIPIMSFNEKLGILVVDYQIKRAEQQN